MKILSETHKEKISQSQKGKPKSETARKKMSNAKRGKPKSETTRKKMSNAQKGKKNNFFGHSHKESTLTKITEIKLGGFWYGNVRYDNKKQYCELWNRDLWVRIDAYQNFKSILSGKTKSDNNNKALSRHHIYYQKKACCEWDEDSQGYFAMINLGTTKKPKMYKYYVGTDPNKFVLLTNSEHAMTIKNKLKWIILFEGLIEEKLKGKCYYSKNEWLQLIEQGENAF